MPNNDRHFMIEDANIIFRNFSGKEGPYNKEGHRNFTITLPEDIAAAMIEDDYNVRMLKPREEGDEPRPVIQVHVRFDVFPPRVVLITSTARTYLDEESIGVLDWADISMVDLIIRPYDWNYGGKTGTKAMVQSLFVTIEEDALERKYEINENPPQK